MAHGVWVQYWEESERGWGVRPDGCWLYATEALAKSHTKSEQARQRAEEKKLYGGMVPDEYSRPAGEPQFKEVALKLAKQVQRKRKVFQLKWL